jgi:NADP-dependent 3-hydroxy acid dehydrogenase YdfG
VYNATKFAVRALTEALRLDTLGTGLRVTTVDPGMAETEFSLVRFKGNEERAKSVYAGMRPLSAEDVAEAIVWSLERPAHVNVQEILLMPTDQASPRDVHRRT